MPDLDLAFIVPVGGRRSEEVDGMDTEFGNVAGLQEGFVQLSDYLDPVGYKFFDTEGLGSKQDIVGSIYFQGITTGDGGFGDIDAAFQGPLFVKAFPKGFHRGSLQSRLRM